MPIHDYFYESNLLPAAPVAHGYRNIWIRDLYYIGISSDEETRRRLWKAMIEILDRYRDKLTIHARQKPPRFWYEYMHVRYSPDGFEIGNDHWLHNQWDAIGNWLEVCLDEERLDLAELLVDYLNMVKYAKKPAAGAWEDRNSCDAYSLAACIHALQKAKKILKGKRCQIEEMIKIGCRRLYGVLLPYATNNRLVCLSLLGVVWPFDMGGPYKGEIIHVVKKSLMREPFGFIRYVGDTYDGEGFARTVGTETPWLLGDCFMSKIEPHQPLWRKRLDEAQKAFGCMPEAFYPESMKMNRNSPLLWAEAMFHSL